MKLFTKLNGVGKLFMIMCVVSIIFAFILKRYSGLPFAIIAIPLILTSHRKER